MTTRSMAPSAPVSDSTRYQMERKLGEGGAGAVYLVRDRETGEQLALKKLFRMDAKSVLRLKREFRSMQAINHPHLIKLYDMGHADDSWFLTMEYLDGVDLTTYLNADRSVTTTSGEPVGGPHLLGAFRQLARAIQALHDVGMLHRDLKPSNVFVVDHRVVVLDFGLVRELSVSAATVSEDGALSGTPAYMAPEQILGNELTAASDWYAFGAMLYEAISGLLPVEGALMELLRAKLESDPEPLESIVPDAPRWLCELCTALLQRDPAKRPSGPAIVAQFEALQPMAALPATQTENLLLTELGMQAAPRKLVGRAAETEQLWAAFEQAEGGRAVVAHVRGLSGAGKSALIEHFMDQVEQLGSTPGKTAALVLRSRCYELEAMPFKALDGVMDVLMRHLSRLNDMDVAHQLPADVAALARVFPVFERLNAVKLLMTSAKPTTDAVQSRLRAETALRKLLENLAARTTIVIWIDDLQWGDLDSARILKSWLAQPSAAAILFVFSYRADEIATSTCLRKLLDKDEEHDTHAPETTIDVAPLAADDIRALCETGFGPQTPARSELIARVVREAQGSPFLASQLIALAVAKSSRGDADLHTLSLDLMVAQTSALLSEDAQRLLAFLAVAGRPLSPNDVMHAAKLKRGGRALVHDLRGLNLVRTRDVGGQRMLEVYHDRVRERVQSALSNEESRAIHRGLLDAFEFSGEVEPDWLHTLALGASDSAAALQHGCAAAERASASLAFERAAALLRKCIELAAADNGGLWSKLAWALARCGRGVEAAEASLEAANHAPEHERVSWLQRAASHYLRSGHFAQGEALVRKVLEAKQISVPTSSGGQMAAIVWERARVKLRGSRDELRDVQDVPAELLERIDLLLALSFETRSYDPVRATLFQVRALRAALEAGEPRRLAGALCSASQAAALDGSARAAHEAELLLARAASVDARHATPDPKQLHLTRAMNAFMLGRMHEVLAPAREAERLFRSDSQDDPHGNYHSRLVVTALRLGTVLVLGPHDGVAAELHGLVAEAVATDNRALLLQLTLVQTLSEHYLGQSSKSRSRLERQRAELPEGCFGILHVLHMVALMTDVCRIGDYAANAAYLDDAWTRFSRSPMRRVAYLAVLAHAAHGTLILNRHVAESREGEPTRVREDIAALARFASPTATGSEHYLMARLALRNGHTERAVAALRASSVASRTRDTAPCNAAREECALGALLQGDEGRALRATAEQRLRELGIVDVAGLVHAYFPELFEAS
jgi:predicted Ser/Thr protein kinase/tetratricopeptide (TPR) repeat protein